MQIIISTTDPIDAANPLYRGELGTGRINANRAIRMALGLPVESIQTIVPPAGKTSYIAVGAARLQKLRFIRPTENFIQNFSPIAKRSAGGCG